MKKNRYAEPVRQAYAKKAKSEKFKFKCGINDMQARSRGKHKKSAG